MTAILIATIGTRDLMFQISSGDWFNVGDDRMQDGDIIGEQAEVLADLNLGKTSYRDLTKYLLDNLEQFIDRIKPVIIGKLLTEQATQIDKLCLIGTDQKIEVPQRSKDSINTCELIKAWVEKKHQITTEIIPLGRDGINPADFEAMFEWWRQTWRKEINPAIDQEIWLSLKGGVGQTSEAGRISGLSLYGNLINFFDFHQNEKHNRAGNPSNYTGPFLGTNYLWDRTRQQALGMIDRYDYAGAQALLQPYIENKKIGGAIPNLLVAGIAWNQGQFDRFSQKAKAVGLCTNFQQQGELWMAYEQAYLAIVRLEQNNTAEAMLHSFRAVEGCLLEWMKVKFPNEFVDHSNKFPTVKPAICDRYPQLKSTYDKTRGQYAAAQWRGDLRREIVEAVLQGTKGKDFKGFWDSQEQRNQLAHRLGGLSKEEVFDAWGADIKNKAQWEARILACLNILTEQKFKTLAEASLFAKLQEQVKNSIKSI